MNAFPFWVVLRGVTVSGFLAIIAMPPATSSLKREIALAAQRQLRALGRRVTMDPGDVGSLKLNVTYK